MAARRRTQKPAELKVARRAIQIGRSRAEEALSRRRKALAARRSALTRRVANVPAPKRSDLGHEPAPMLSSATAGLLVAEGDSWFDYPLSDVLQVLQDDHAYDVESVAHKGDRVEDMAYSDGQLDALARLIEKLVRKGETPQAILLSGGGNDVAGDEFGVLLDHARSLTPGLNRSVVDGVLHQRVAQAYIAILAAVTHLCEKLLARKVPIILHGYDYAVPDGRGFLGGWWVLPGPWLEPGFRAKGYGQMARRQQVVCALIDEFNDMLARLVAQPQFAHVHHLDLRGTLSFASGAYRKDWANELHPTHRGWRLVAEKFAEVLEGLPHP
jgi:lysophospholipase L1-like esterase